MSVTQKTIDNITRTKTSLDGDERIPGRDDSGDFKILASLFLAAIESEPVGTIKDWHKSMPNAPTSPGDSYVECDGAKIDDSESVFDGYRSPNLNGADVVLTLTWTADAGGSYATVSATDITALGEGDDVTGSGIAANSYISDITGTTVTITDTAASGSISSTFTNDGLFTRGGSTSGAGQKDQMQKLTGTFDVGNGNNSARMKAGTGTGVFTVNKGSGSGYLVSSTIFSSTDYTESIDFDSSNSPNARTSSTTYGETRPSNRSMVKIMKIK